MGGGVTNTNVKQNADSNNKDPQALVLKSKYNDVSDAS